MPDSGVSGHKTFDMNALFNNEKLPPSSLRVGNKETVVVAGEGNIEVNLIVCEHHRKAKFKFALHVPGLSYSLLSATALIRKAFEVSVDSPAGNVLLKALSLLWQL